MAGLRKEGAASACGSSAQRPPHLPRMRCGLIQSRRGRASRSKGRLGCWPGRGLGCGSGERAQERGGAGPRPVAERPAGEEETGEGKERRGKELTRGANSPEREERKRAALSGETGADRRARVAAREREGRERGVAGLGRSGLGRGPRGREGRGESWAAGEGEERGLGRLGWALFLSFSFPNSIPIQIIYLNSNKFEFKPYKFNTRKTMLQHECTNILIL
jgi:hypothetical protein